tara:strand:- start:771 stop:1967 length:1197 start_codon:yes stop_codon:yes gene_type:complete
MGISSGIPLYIVLSTLLIWLTRENIDISTVGLFALTQIPWSIKFLWAPLVDNLKIPFLTDHLGQRKSWLLLTQILLIISILLLGFSDPLENIFLTAIYALFVSFFSANQDIIIDAYRIEILDEKSQGAGAAMTQFGYRIGGILVGAGSLYLKSVFSWASVFVIIASLIFVLMILTIFVLPERKEKKRRKIKKKLTEPFREFIYRNAMTKVLLIITFIFFFKFGDVIAGVMANPFYVKTGFTNIEIANASKFFGVIMTVLGVFVGGFLVKKYGLLKSLIISSFFQIFSNLLYVMVDQIGPNFNVLLIAVSGENFSGGLGSAAFVAYLSTLCNKSYTGTQYALLSSFMGLSRTILSSPSGFLVEMFGWTKFFIFSTFLGFPGLFLLFWMRKHFPISEQKP